MQFLVIKLVSCVNNMEHVQQKVYVYVYVYLTNQIKFFSTSSIAF